MSQLILLYSNTYFGVRSKWCGFYTDLIVQSGGTSQVVHIYLYFIWPIIIIHELAKCKNKPAIMDSVGTPCSWLHALPAHALCSFSSDTCQPLYPFPQTLPHSIPQPISPQSDHSATHTPACSLILSILTSQFSLFLARLLIALVPVFSTSGFLCLFLIWLIFWNSTWIGLLSSGCLDIKVFHIFIPVYCVCVWVYLDLWQKKALSCSFVQDPPLHKMLSSYSSYLVDRQMIKNLDDHIFKR